MAQVLSPYILYVALYLGVALTGGSVVHLPLDPGRYILIGLVGVFIFIAASAFDARRRHAAAAEGAALGRYLAWSVVLSLGLGMLSGSIQHFLDFPHYAAVLLPLGVPVTLAAYMGRERLSMPRAERWPLIAIAGGFTLALGLGLDWLADELAPHGH
jgi:hypothetical protein